MTTTISITPKSKVGLFILMAAYQPQSTLLSKLETVHGSALLLTSSELDELTKALSMPKALEGIGRHKWVGKLKTEIGFQHTKQPVAKEPSLAIKKLEAKLLKRSL